MSNKYTNKILMKGKKPKTKKIEEWIECEITLEYHVIESMPFTYIELN